MSEDRRAPAIAEYVLDVLKKYKCVEKLELRLMTEQLRCHKSLMGCRPGLKKRCLRPCLLTVMHTKLTQSKW